MYVLSPNSVVTDSVRVVPVAQQILRHQTISLDADRAVITNTDYGITRRGGHLYPLFPWTVSLFLLPAVAIVDVAHAAGLGAGAQSYGGGSPSDWPLEVISMSVVVAVAAGLLYQVGFEAAESKDERVRRRLAAAVALVFAFGTSAWSTASRGAWQLGPSMLFVSWAVLLATRARRGRLAAFWIGVSLAGAYVVRPTNALAVGLLGLWVLWKHRRSVPRFAAGAGVVLAPFVAVNLAAYHALLPPYFLGSSFGAKRHVATALAGNLVSPARGLLVFSPVLALALVGLARQVRGRRADALDAALAATVVCQWIAISVFPNWGGGWQYGPRLFGDVVPFLVVLCLPALQPLVAGIRREARWVAAATLGGVLAAFSAFANFEGAALKSSMCWNVAPDVGNHPGRLWSWSDPQVFAGASGVLRDGLAQELVRGGFESAPLAVACPGARV